MDIRYTVHAEERMIERGISRQAVHDALIYGQKSDAEAGRRRAIHAQKGSTVTVIYSSSPGNKFIIITVY